MESWDSSNGNKYVIRNSSSYSLDQFFTPLLEVAEGESLTFDVSARYSYSSKLQILYSADRTNWTEAKDFAYDDISTSGYYDLRNVSVSGIPGRILPKRTKRNVRIRISFLISRCFSFILFPDLSAYTIANCGCGKKMRENKKKVTGCPACWGGTVTHYQY